jgi:hypothetical protein
MDSLTAMRDLIAAYNSRVSLLCDAASVDHVPVTLNPFALDQESLLSLMTMQDAVLASLGEEHTQCLSRS